MPKLQIHLKPSRLFFIMLLVIIFGAIISIFCSFLPYYIQLLLMVAVLFYGLHIIWKEVGLWSPKAIVALACGEDNTWLLKERSGQCYPAVLSRASTHLAFSGWPGLSILRFKLMPSVVMNRARKMAVVVFHDAVNPDIYRQMLMRLGVTKIH